MTSAAPYVPPVRDARGWLVAPIQIDFALSVTPALTIIPAGTGVEIISVSPALAMNGAGRSAADFGLAVTPAIGAAPWAGLPYTLPFPLGAPLSLLALTVTPAVAFTGAEHYSASAGLDVSASVGIAMNGAVHVAPTPKNTVINRAALIRASTR